MVKKIFFTGATGYIGGSFLYRLLNRPDVSDYEITLLTRQKDKAEGFHELGCKTIVGNLQDYDLIREECKKADIVIQTADCDEYEFGRAVIGGMKAHKEATGQIPILLHTSGTGVLVVDSKGQAPTSSDPIYDDSNVSQLKSIPKDAPHREGDLQILEADAKGYLKAYLIFPSTIYGEATGDLGKGEWKGKLMNRRSIQIPLAIRLALKRGRPGVYGEGKNIWPHVHIDDLMKLYETVFDLAKDGKGDHGENGYYFAENGQYEYRKVSEAIGKAMQKRNIGTSAEPSAYGNELKEALGDMAWYVGSTGQCRATHSRSIGWKPTHTTEDFYNAIDEEVEAQIEKQKQGGSHVNKA